MKFQIVDIQDPDFVHGRAWAEIVELVYYGLENAGFEVDYSINSFARNRINIIFGCFRLKPELAPLVPKDSFMFNLEQLKKHDDLFDHNTRMNIRFWAQKGFRFLDYDRNNISTLLGWGAQDVRIVELGFAPELARLEKQNKVYDCIFYGGRNKRRNRLLAQVHATGLNLKYLWGVYGEERDREIEKSGFALNMHLYESEMLEIVRLNYLLHNKISVLTEMNDSTSDDTQMGEVLISVPREQFAAKAIEISGDQAFLERKANEAFDWLVQKPQSKIMRTIFN